MRGLRKVARAALAAFVLVALVAGVALAATYTEDWEGAADPPLFWGDDYLYTSATLGASAYGSQVCFGGAEGEHAASVTLYKGGRVAAATVFNPAQGLLSAYFGANRTPVSEQIEHSFRTKPYSVSLETEHQLALTGAAQDS